MFIKSSTRLPPCAHACPSRAIAFSMGNAKRIFLWKTRILRRQVDGTNRHVIEIPFSVNWPLVGSEAALRVVCAALRCTKPPVHIYNGPRMTAADTGTQDDDSTSVCGWRPFPPPPPGRDCLRDSPTWLPRLARGMQSTKWRQLTTTRFEKKGAKGASWMATPVTDGGWNETRAVIREERKSRCAKKKSTSCHGPNCLIAIALLPVLVLVPGGPHLVPNFFLAICTLWQRRLRASLSYTIRRRLSWAHMSPMSTGWLEYVAEQTSPCQWIEWGSVPSRPKLR